MRKYQHWLLTTTPKTKQQGLIGWLGFDRKESSVNSINDNVLNELNDCLHDVAENQDIQGLVIYSLKAKGFIAGADVNAIAQLKTAAEVTDFLRKGQTVFSRLENLTIPTVAMINGFCMGGGLELSLACDYRIATDAEETRIGLPEVLLGFHPGWGGTVRLPKLIGGFHALTQVMLTGAPLSAKKAKQLGVVDEVVPLRQLKRAAQYFIEQRPALHKATWIQAATQFPWVRMFLARIIRNQLSKKVRQAHYPAPFAMLNLWEKESEYDDRAFLKELDSVEQLVSKSETAANLIRLFLLRERLKKFAYGLDEKVKHVHVIGAGVMGGDIAAYCAYKGLKVTLQDKDYPQIAPAINRAHILFQKKLKSPRLTQQALDRLQADPTGQGIAHADMIIEAVFENLELKQAMVQSIEQQARPNAMIATNTSSIPLAEISQAMQDPRRLVGIHFFNPVAKMELIEIVSTAETLPEVMQRACAFVGQLGRLPLPVKSTPGFLINRILMPYLLECMVLLAEGVSKEDIDWAAKSFGMMMGPVELADTVGLDVCLAVAENLSHYFGGNVPDKLKTLVEQGKKGRKTDEGFYRYKQGRALKQPISRKVDYKAIAQRLVRKLIEESERCLAEHVVADADLLDAGMVFGTGFAPFRGGPLHYAQQGMKKPTLKRHFKPEIILATEELREG
jgi:3-hydroxyacyl-CoA dehydrogenase/enoyl-CoA hydratase/3-hydroxybutyryl-CoA epimerase